MARAAGSLQREWMPSPHRRPMITRLSGLPILAAVLFGALSGAFARPEAPASVLVTPSDASGEVTLSWSAVSGADAYAVRRATSIRGPFTTLAASHTGTAYVDSTATPGVFAYYVVTALAADGESPASRGVWAAPAVILDNVAPGGSAPGIAYTGSWSTSTLAGSHGANAVFATAVISSTPTATYTFTPSLPARGRYDVYLRWTSSASRATAAPFDFVTPDATRTLTFNQQNNGSAWNLATTLVCEAGSTTSVTLRNNGTVNNVVADAVQFVPRHAPLAPDAERPQDYTVAVIQDHFDGAAINPATWKQFQDRPHFSVSDGKLRLRLVWTGPRPLAEATAAEIGSDLNWNEGGVTAQHSQKFGYHEARFRIPPPAARGVDTAYWHLATDAVLSSYEIDAPEFFNKDATGANNDFGFGVWDHTPPTRQIAGLPYGRTWDYAAKNASLASFADVSGYLTVGLEWRTDNTQVVYVNGRKLHTAPASGMNDVESILPANIILSTKVLNWMGPSAGLEGAEALWDYAFYYQKPGWLGAASSAWNDAANWGPEGVPAAGRAAVFNVAPPSPVVTIASEQSVSSLSLDGAGLPALTFSGAGSLRLGVSPDTSLTHGGVLVNTAVTANQTIEIPIVGAQSLQFANLSRTPGTTLRLNGLISGDGVAPRDVDFVSSTASNTTLGPIVLGQPLGPGLRHVNRSGDGEFILPAGSRHAGELRIARGTVVLPDATALGLDPLSAIVFRPNSKHSESFRPRLRHLGPAATLHRPVHLAGWQADAIIESHGTGPLTLNGPFVLRPSSPDPEKVLTRDLRLVLNALSGSGENVLAAPLSDLGLVVSYTNADDTTNTGPATLTLTKTGAGTWILAADNNLAEPVAVTGGRLVVGQGATGSLNLRTSPRTGAAPAVAVSSGAELVFGRDDDAAFSAAVSGAGGLRKRGAGGLTLGGAHTFSGPVAVQAGALRLEGSLSGAGTITVSANATLSGSGSAAGGATVDGTLQVSPLAIGGTLALRAASTLRAAFAGNAAPSPAPASASILAVSTGARVAVALDGPGSAADLRHVFWRSPRTFRLVSTTARSGALALAPPGVDSAGNAVSAFGSFSLQHAATGVDLLWTPVSGYPSYDYITIGAVSPPASVASLPGPDHLLRLSVQLGGGRPDTLVWTRVSGPGAVAFENAAAADTFASFSAPGSYVLRLVATNILGPVSRDVVVNVAPPASLVLVETASPSGLHPAAFIRGDGAGWNSGARDQLLVGRNNGGLRALLAFDLSALPPGAATTAANLELWGAAAGAGATVGPLDLHRLRAPFVEGAGDGSAAANGAGTGADWNNRAPGLGWTSPGASADADRDPAPLQSHPAFNPTASDIAGRRLPFASTPALVDAVAQAVAAGEPLRFLLKASNDTTGANAFARIASDDHASDALRPRLTLTLRHAFTPAVSSGAAPIAIAGQPAALAGSATGAATTRWSLASGPSAPVFAAADALATTVAFPAPGEHVLRLSAANANGESARLLSVGVLPRRAAWRQTHFGQTAGSGPAGDLSDPDADGLVNLIEYALGSHPLEARGGAPTSTLAVDRLALVFARVADPELVYAVEASADLTAWSPIWTSSGALNVAGPVTVLDAAGVSTGSRRFLRLRVSAP